MRGVGPHTELADLPLLAGAFGIGEARCRADEPGQQFEQVYAFAAIGAVVSGHFDYRSPTGAIEAGPGTVLLGNRDEVFACRHLDDRGNFRSVISLDPGLLLEVANDCGVEPKFRTVGLSSVRAAVGLYGSVRRAAAGRADEEALVALVAATLGLDVDVDLAEIGRPEARRVREVAGLIEEAYSESWTLSRMATLAGISRFHFIRVFRSVTGENPRQFLIGRRLRAAADQLLDSDEPVTRVALDAGFNDISTFNAVFRRAFGMAPRAWRAAA